MKLRRQGDRKSGTLPLRLRLLPALISPKSYEYYPAERHVSGLAETRLARPALRVPCSALLPEGCSSAVEHPGNREAEGSIPFDSTSD